MNKKMLMNNALFTLVILCSLSILPGCYLVDWVKDKMGQRSRVEKETMTAASAEGIVGVVNDGSKVLVTFKGAPVITEKSFAVKKQDLMESNPQYKEAVAMMGGEAKCDEYILEGLARTALLNQYIVDKGVDKKSDYQKDYDRAVSNIKDILNAKYFAQDIPVKVTDAEVSAFYEKNKDQLPGVRQSTGGIKSIGVSFDSEKAAQDFMAKAKEAGDIRKAAKDAGIAADKIQDFGLVHERSGAMNPTLKEKIMLITKFPTTMVIKVDDKTYWVVTATAKEAAKYTPLDQVKDNFKKYLEQEKLGEAFEKEINKLKEQYQVTISGKEPMAKEEMPMTEPEMPMNKMQEPKKAMKPTTKAKTGTKSVKKEKTASTTKVA